MARDNIWQVKIVHVSFSKARIVIIEEDKDLAAIIRIPLRRKGYCVRRVMKRKQAVTRALRHHPDLVILGPGLSREEAFAFCRQFRAGSLRSSGLIVIILNQSSDSDALESLTAGADVCLTNPINGRVSIARIEALLRMRALRREEKADGWGNRQVVRAGLLVVDRERHFVGYDGQVIKSTQAQRDLLWYMILRCGQALSREDLMNVVTTRAKSSASNSVDWQLAQIRKQLGKGAFCIETLTGYGYKLHREPLHRYRTSQGRIQPRNSPGDAPITPERD